MSSLRCLLAFGGTHDVFCGDNAAVVVVVVVVIVVIVVVVLVLVLLMVLVLVCRRREKSVVCFVEGCWFLL